jgi:creatinine amidohydrolase/Fe(II)-dependent formamide hydrolase-like protein
LITTGFKNVVLMSDDGGGQKPLSEIATKLNAKYSSQGIRVVWAGDVYRKAGQDFNKWLTEKGLPVGSHASIKDTSQLLYLEGDQRWVRKELLPTAIGVRGFAVNPNGANDPNAKPVRNGISGDARLSSPEIGKVIADLKVDSAVAQIRSLLGPGGGQK